MYDVLVTALLPSLGYNFKGTQSAIDELTTTVRGTHGVLQMMAMSWIKEARDERGTMGFLASIFHASLSHCRSEFEHLVISGGGGGGAKDVAKLAFCCISHNFHRLKLVPTLVAVLTRSLSDYFLNCRDYGNSSKMLN